jgi:DNA repair exonuclease SbcCD nuclease subunit
VKPSPPSQASHRQRPEIRILFVADTHLGFDMPARPRVERRRRGPDFFRNFELALGPAREGRVDLVVHGGDLFHRSRVPVGVVREAIECIRPVVERGIPFVIVPGNHERSSIPFRLLWDVPNVHVFDRPRTFRFRIRGADVALSGFPYRRGDARDAFEGLVAAAKADGPEPTGVQLLCMHQVVEGATVGAQDFVFRGGADVIPGRLIPRGFAAVLSGHIHRAQVLRRDLSGRRLATPVIYPGSTERTAFAERLEAKGCVHLTVKPGAGGGAVDRCGLRRLPARPMVCSGISTDALSSDEIRGRLRRLLSDLDPDSVVRIEVSEDARTPLSAASVRSLAPASMHVEIRAAQDSHGAMKRSRARRSRA